MSHFTPCVCEIYINIKSIYSWTTVCKVMDSKQVNGDVGTSGTNGFRIPDLINKKKHGEELTQDEIEYFVKGVVDGYVQDSQLGAMLMAIIFKDLNTKETTCLTRAMVESGETLHWPESWQGLLVDKHSTGGVGDKISLVLAPALAACGMKVPMVSGRGLGHTGGTLDKLEAIPGFTVSVSTDRMQTILDKVGCCIVGQTSSLVPADKIMYATRDVTATIDHVGLITASIISKKAAERLNALVLDVKCGKGAFFKCKDTAGVLAKSMVAIGNGLGINTVALITRMDVPIGRNIGNALEVAESIQCLHGNGPRDVMELVINLGGQLLYKCGKASSLKEGCSLIKGKLDDGSALKTFTQMIHEQGVESELAKKLCDKNTDVWTILPKSKYRTDVKCLQTGYVHEIDAMPCAIVSGKLGAGRAKSGDPINYAVGLELQTEVGKEIKEGDPWVRVYHEQEAIPSDLLETLQQALHVKSVPLDQVDGNMVLEVIS